MSAGIYIIYFLYSCQTAYNLLMHLNLNYYLILLIQSSDHTFSYVQLMQNKVGEHKPMAQVRINNIGTQKFSGCFIPFNFAQYI